MQKRNSKVTSKVFQNVLKQAGDRLLLDASAAENLEHNGLRGNQRAAALREFLAKHLPAVFEVGNGEAIDFRDARSGELDLFIYDRATAAALQTSSASALVPAEALYAVIEVKTTLSQNELDTSAKAAERIRRLKPFKQAFVAAQTEGRVASGRARCPYFVFSYKTNLSAEGWAQKEFERIKAATAGASVALDAIDRVIVLDRGIILPQARMAILKDDSHGLFLEFYLHLVNFLTRERRRRPTIDWTAYTGRRTWTKLI
ncbi:DUF6602 domain-containing protein [Mesorhizobium sp.]|uniref:DUF6602 domain-containing protein n=1 Tax=Mesorhizobium sp. TaxID=1871066 RepID=UPI000FE98EF3|nr:DUF6602 domain-containing protein [Mesorhizobium sp.]RWQ13601.1 MAG: hypothetical protein EOR93_31570 [Mesorhizobium sp.]